MDRTVSFDVTLLGSDINVYGMARSFHEAYGIVSDAYAEVQLAPTKYSKIVRVHLHPNFTEGKTFLEVLKTAAEKLDPNKKHLLIACGDAYAALIAENLAELKKYFICPYISYELQEKLTNKVTFYEICEKYQLPHPKTLVIKTPEITDPKKIQLPFAFPVALKPANSVEWLDIQFVGRKKAYRLKTREEFDDLLLKIKAAGYQSELICQDFIPGDDSHMRVLNGYVGKNGEVQLLCLGHPLLEDPSPASIGNYMVILPDYQEKIYQTIKKFFEDVQYTGFVNFDMKYDVRDGEYKLFELNPRQGRSSFFVTLNGYNLAKFLVEDWVEEKAVTQTVYGNGNKLWLGVPKGIFKKYVKDSPDKKKAEELLKANQAGTTVFYKQDMSFKRWGLLTYMFTRYHKTFKRFFKENKE